jgi:hypothetical protein
MSNAVTPDANLSGKDDSAISQEQINKIRSRYELEEQKQKAIEDLKNAYNQKHEDNNKKPLAVGDSSNNTSTPITPVGNTSPRIGNNPFDVRSSKIFDKKFSHYTEQKKKEILDMARRELEKQKRQWDKDEQNLRTMKLAAQYDAEGIMDYDLLRELFGSIPEDREKRHSIYNALKLLNIPFSEYIWSRENDYKGQNSDGIDFIDKRIAQFPTEAHVLQAYSNCIEALRIRDVISAQARGQRITVVCPDCLNAAVKARDTLLDVAKHIKFIRCLNRLPAALQQQEED